MPMRDELVIRSDQSRRPARSLAWRRAVDDPDFEVIAIVSLIGALVAILMTVHCVVPDSAGVVLMTLS
jgi:hypothetical protein